MNNFTQKVFSFVVGMTLFALNAEAQQVFYESFDGLTEAEGGNDGYFDNADALDGDICEYDLTDASLLDNPIGWGDFVAIAQGKQCVRISSKNNSGTITTPSISLEGSDGVLTFNAAGYSTDAATLHIKVVDDATQLTYNGVTSSEITIDIPVSDKTSTILANQTYKVRISGVATPIQLSFSTVSSKSDKQRVFLDEIKVVKDSADGISSIQNYRVTSGKTYTIDGREVKNTCIKHGVYIRDGKKVML